MAFLCINPKVAMVRIRAKEQLEELTGEFYINLDKVIEVLKESGFPDNSVFAIGQDLGTENEIVRQMTLGEVNDSSLTTKYFSILVVKRV